MSLTVCLRADDLKISPVIHEWLESRFMSPTLLLHRAASEEEAAWGNVFLRTFYACWNKSKHPVFFVFEGDTGTSTTVSCCQSPALEAMSPCFSLLSMSLNHRWVVSSTARCSAKLHYFSRKSAKYLEARGTVFSLLKISACAFQSVSQRDGINVPWGSQCIFKFLYLIFRPIDQ